MADTGVHNLVSRNLDHIVESGLFTATFNDALEIRKTWEGHYKDEAIPVHDGQTFWVAKKQTPSAQQDPTPPANDNDIDSGLTSLQPKVEKFPMNLNLWNNMVKTNTRSAAIAFADIYPMDVQFLAETARLTLDLQARRALSQAFFGGNTFATAAFGAPQATVDVKNVNGFKYLYQDGVRFDVSPSKPLEVKITSSVTATTYTVNVIGFTEGTRDNATDMIPGTLTLDANIPALAIGDPVIAKTAPPSVRPNGKTTDFNLDAADKLSWDMLVDTTTLMYSHGIMPHENGLYKMSGDPVHFNALLKDESFQRLLQGRYDAEEVRRGQALIVGNILFDFSNQAPSKMLTETGQYIRRALVTGRGAGCRGYYKGDPSVFYKEVSPLHNVTFDPKTHIHLIIRKPIDAVAKVFTTSYEANLGYAAATDSLAKFGEFPDADFKCGVAISTT